MVNKDEYKDVTLSTVSVNTLRQSDSVRDATQKRRHVDSASVCSRSCSHVD